MKKIVFVEGDEWEGLYIDNKLATEDHSLSVFEVLDLIGVNYKVVYPDDDWLYKVGKLPERLGKVKRNENI